MEGVSRRIFLPGLALAVVAVLAMSAVSVPMAYAHHPDNIPNRAELDRTDEFGSGEFSMYMEGITDVSGNEVILQADGPSHYGSYTFSEWYDSNFNGQVDNEWEDTDGDYVADESEWNSETDDLNGNGYPDNEWIDSNGDGIVNEHVYDYNYFDVYPGFEDEYGDFPGEGFVSMTVDGISGISFDIDGLYGSVIQLGDIHVIYFYLYNSDWSDWREHDGAVVVAQLVTAEDSEAEDYGAGALLNIKGIIYSGVADHLYAVQSGYCPDIDQYYEDDGTGGNLDEGEDFDESCDWVQVLEELQLQASWDETFSGNVEAENVFLGGTEDSQVVENTLGLHAEGDAIAKVNKVNTEFEMHVYAHVNYECDPDGKIALPDDYTVSGTFMVDDDEFDIEGGTIKVDKKKVTLDVKKGDLSSNSKDTLKVTWDAPSNFDCADDDEGVDFNLGAGKAVIIAKVTVDGKQVSLNTKKVATGQIDYNGVIEP